MPKSILLVVVLAGGLALLYLGLFAVTATAPSTLTDGFTPFKEELSRKPKENVFPATKNEFVRNADEAGKEQLKMSEVTNDLVFYQKGDSVLDIGGLSVLPGFPDESGRVVPMLWIGDPASGDEVRLTYRIVEGKPTFVYGVRLVLLSSGPAQAISVDGSSLPTAIPTFSARICEPVRPEGWILYRSTVDDSLVSLAIRTGTPLRTILSVNCRADSQLAAGVSIFLPAVLGVTVPDAS